MQQVKRNNPHLANPLDKKPRLMDAGRPVLAAYNHVMRWADGFGGVSHDTLEWYLTRGEGSLLTPTTQQLVRDGVEALIDQDRRIQAEEAEKARRK